MFPWVPSRNDLSSFCSPSVCLTWLSVFFILELHKELGIHTGGPCLSHIPHDVPLGVQERPPTETSVFWEWHSCCWLIVNEWLPLVFSVFIGLMTWIYTCFMCTYQSCCGLSWLLRKIFLKISSKEEWILNTCRNTCSVSNTSSII